METLLLLLACLPILLMVVVGVGWFAFRPRRLHNRRTTRPYTRTATRGYRGQ